MEQETGIGGVIRRVFRVTGPFSTGVPSNWTYSQPWTAETIRWREPRSPSRQESPFPDGAGWPAHSLVPHHALHARVRPGHEGHLLLGADEPGSPVPGRVLAPARLVGGRRRTLASASHPAPLAVMVRPGGGSLDPGVRHLEPAVARRGVDHPTHRSVVRARHRRHDHRWSDRLRGQVASSWQVVAGPPNPAMQRIGPPRPSCRLGSTPSGMGRAPRTPRVPKGPRGAPSVIAYLAR